MAYEVRCDGRGDGAHSSGPSTDAPPLRCSSSVHLRAARSGRLARIRGKTKVPNLGVTAEWEQAQALAAESS